MAFLFAVVLQPFGAEPRNLAGQWLGEDTELAETDNQYRIDSALYPIAASWYPDAIQCGAIEPECREPRNGGGIEPLGNGFLIVSGGGDLHYASYQPDHTLATRMLGVANPINAQDFLDAGHESSLWLFRATDLMVVEGDQGVDVYVGHHQWDNDQACVFLQISRASTTKEALLERPSEVQWQEVFRTEPCLKMQTETWDWPFRGDEAGGKLLMDKGGEFFYFTTGDHSFDGQNSPVKLSQESDSDYGRVFQIRLDDFSAETMTWGHRNPQGLWQDLDGEVWITEHGPQGGDELNKLVSGTNYGWPLVTLGTEYGAFDWPQNSRQGRHDGYPLPVFAWVPSTATSGLIRITGKKFRRWKGDFLVSSYKKTLWRLRMNEGRVLYAEPIAMPDAVQGRVRDVFETAQGNLLLLTDKGALAELTPSLGSEDDPAAAFGVCRSCHSVTPGEGHLAGPNLAGVVDAKIARHDDFIYSEALANLGETWTRA